MNPYPEEECGPPKGLISLMAVLQANKKKSVRSWIIGNSINMLMHTNVAVLDLRRAYLQVHVDKSLWLFQTVNIKGHRYCFTRLGFRLNMAPIIMRSIINMVMAQDETIQGATSSYIDDIFVNESAYTATHVRAHLLRFGLICKYPERLRDGTRVLGLRVMEEQGKLQW